MNYPVMEHFQTLQGEGKYAGHSAYFIRLGGCDVGCVWCDVKDSWDAAAHPIIELESLKIAIANSPSEIVVITGGEPTMHDLAPLCAAIHALGKRAHIETAGTNDITGEMDWICLSPKKFKAPLPSALAQAHELKVIVFNNSDFKFAESFEPTVPIDCKLYLQVEWSKREKLQQKILDYITANPRWALSVQTHKYLGIE